MTGEPEGYRKTSANISAMNRPMTNASAIDKVRALIESFAEPPRP